MSRGTFQDLLGRTRGQKSVLEIGPLNRPLAQGENVFYFDLLPTDQLRLKALGANLDPSGVPEIHFFDPNGSLDSIGRKFEYIVSSHLIEHQLNLIKHLASVARLLETGGEYWLIVPDQRYCFDHFLPPSRLSEVVMRHETGQMQPSKWQLMEHRALTTHNDCVRHWAGDHGEIMSNLKSKVESSTREFYSYMGEYFDVHCWQFTPQSFIDLVDALNLLELTNFTVQDIFETAKNDLEFFCILKRGS